MEWRFQNGSTVVNSSAILQTVTVAGPCVDETGPCEGAMTRVFRNTDAGSSSFRYSADSWTFNLQTKDPNGVPFPLGYYRLTITPGTPGFQASPTYSLQLTR